MFVVATKLDQCPVVEDPMPFMRRNFEGVKVHVGNRTRLAGSCLSWVRRGGKATVRAKLDVIWQETFRAETYTKVRTNRMMENLKKTFKRTNKGREKITTKPC